MVSFTGSDPAGIEVARKRGAHGQARGQELGGKSANILLDDADLAGTFVPGRAPAS
jgi:aldehyde dehydrogenase (NAD+)